MKSRDLSIHHRATGLSDISDKIRPKGIPSSNSERKSQKDTIVVMSIGWLERAIVMRYPMTKPLKLVIISTIEMTEQDLCQWERWHKSQFDEQEGFYENLFSGQEVTAQRDENHLVSFQLMKNEKIM